MAYNQQSVNKVVRAVELAREFDILTEKQNRAHESFLNALDTLNPKELKLMQEFLAKEGIKVS